MFARRPLPRAADLLLATTLVSTLAQTASTLGNVYHVDPVRGEASAPGTAQRSSASLKALGGHLKPGDTVLLAGGTYDEPQRLTFSGTADAPITIRAADGQEPVISKTTWTLDGASHLVLEQLTFRECTCALDFRNGASDNIVRGCRFLDCPPPYEARPKSGTLTIVVRGTGPDSHRNRIDGNVFERVLEGWNTVVSEALNVREGNREWVICNNRVRGYYVGMELGHGARGAPPAYITVENNEIFDVFMDAIHVKTSDNIVRGNHIHSIKQGYGSGFGIFLRSGPRTVVESNRIERAGSVGIRVCGKDQLLRNNLITDTPIGIWLSHHSYGRATTSNWVVHNTVVGAIRPLWLSAETEALVFNNIFVAVPREDVIAGILVAGPEMEDPMAGMSSGQRLLWMSYIGRQDAQASLIADYNLFHAVKPPGTPAWVKERMQSERQRKYPISAEWWGAHNFEGDPLFTDPQKGDYSLSPQSPARGAGRALPNAAYDIAGVPRPARPDLGAYQCTGP